MRSTGWSQTVLCPVADTEYHADIKDGTSQIQVRHSDATSTWRWSFAPGVVAGGHGMPMAAAEIQLWSVPVDAPMRSQRIYFAADMTGALEVCGTVTA